MDRKETIKQFKSARMVGTPIIIYNTSDQEEAIKSLTEATHKTVPVYSWDCLNGLVGLTDTAESLLALCGVSKSDFEPNLEVCEAKNLAVSCIYMQNLPGIDIVESGKGGALVFIKNFHRFVQPNEPNSTYILQGISNMRDQFAAHAKTLVLLAPYLEVPAELKGSVLVIDEPLPDSAGLSGILESVVEGATATFPEFTVSEDDKGRAIAAMRGLTYFEAQQAGAMSVRQPNGVPAHLSIEDLWLRKEQIVNQTPGLKFQRGSETLSNIGGLGAVKEFSRSILNGNDSPQCILHMDEIEKALAGAEGDMSGVSQDQLGVLLQSMEDYGWTGLIAVGFPGTGKSNIAKAIGNEKNLPTIRVDLGAMMGSLVGESQQKVRSAVKVLHAIAGERVLAIATCNDASKLKPELNRRFCFGRWMFDLPDEANRKAIWKIYLKKYGLTEQDTPPDIGWTGAEIKTCCMTAYRLNTSVLSASKYIVPFQASNAELIATLRGQAKGRYLCAERGGTYKPPPSMETATLAAAPSQRRFIQGDK